jgi:hypothetical protein
MGPNRCEQILTLMEKLFSQEGVAVVLGHSPVDEIKFKCTSRIIFIDRMLGKAFRCYRKDTKQQEIAPLICHADGTTESSSRVPFAPNPAPSQHRLGGRWWMEDSHTHHGM